METTAAGVSKIKEPEELLAKVSEEKNQVVDTLNKFKIANKPWQKLGKEKLASIAPYREYKQVDVEVQSLSVEN